MQIHKNDSRLLENSSDADVKRVLVSVSQKVRNSIALADRIHHERLMAIRNHRPAKLVADA